MGSVVAVTGLALEARIAAGPGVRTVIGGGNARRLVSALEREIALGAVAIISFGIAGGLIASAARGSSLVARTVVTPTASWSADAAWTRTLVARLPDAILADLAGSDTIIDGRDAKRALNIATGALAVDTESHIAAQVAAMHGLPFAAYRVVVDAVNTDIPSAARRGWRGDGTVDVGAVLGALARSPGQLPALVRTALDARIALRALLRGRRRLGAGLGYPDLGKFLLDVA